METRLYFLTGDVLACAFIGGVTGALSAGLVDTSWNMWVAHVVCMLLGMILAFPLALPFMAAFGAMEVMMPTHFAGMFAGMWVGMQAAMEPTSVAAGLWTGASIGVVSLFLIYLANLWLVAKGDPRGPRHQG
jgi:hypothetical protein